MQAFEGGSEKDDEEVKDSCGIGNNNTGNHQMQEEGKNNISVGRLSLLLLENEGEKVDEDVFKPLGS